MMLLVQRDHPGIAGLGAESRDGLDWLDTCSIKAGEAHLPDHLVSGVSVRRS
jgi:hypothetical protein